MTTTPKEMPMSILSRRRDEPEPEAAPVPAGYVPWPVSKQEAVVPPLVDLGTHGSRMLDGRAPLWAVSPDGRLLGPPSLANSGRPDREHQLTPDEFFVFDVDRPVDGDLEGHIRRQVRGCYCRTMPDGPPRCWQIGQPFPEADPVAVPRVVPVRGLDVGRPLSPQVVRAIVTSHRLGQAVRAEGTGLDSRRLVQISLAYSPETGRGQLAADVEVRDYPKWILTNSLQEITPELLGRVRIAPDGVVVWLPPEDVS